MILAPSAGYQQHLTACPSHIKFNHFDELVNGSAIDPAIAALNFESVQGDYLLEWLTEHKLAQMGGHAQQYATGPVRKLLKKMEPVTDAGGWRCQGLDPFNNWGPMDWGCFKADHPRKGRKQTESGHWKDGEKFIKYEHPQGTPSRAFFCDLDPTNPEVGRERWEQVKSDPSIPIYLCEGAKKAACLMSHGYAAIGLPGVSMWNKPETRELIAELELFAVEGRDFLISYDQDKKRSTRRNVGWEITKLSSALKRYGCKVKVIQWNQELGKGVDDLIAVHGVEPFQQACNQAIRAEVFSVQRMSELGFMPDWVAPAGMKFLSKREDRSETWPISADLDKAIPQDAKLVGIKSGKGTGKTEVAKTLTNQSHAREQRVLFVSHRIALAKALGDRVGVRHIYEFKDKKGEVQANFEAEITANGLSICTHSCHPESQNKFKGDEWADARVMMDEGTQSLWDLLNSSILKKKRVPILKEIKTLLTGVLLPESEGQLILLDADLDYITLDGIRKIAGQPNLDPWIALSNYQERVGNYHAHKNPEQWLMQLEQDLSNDKRLLVNTDSQQAKGKFSSTTLEARWNKKFPHLRILRIDSDSLKTKGHPAFGCIKNLNVLLLLYDVVICSPSVETGISIDIKGHFDKVYGCYQGVLGENSVRQSLARLREPVDRVIYATTRGTEFIGGGETYWKALVENVSRKANAITGQILEASIDDLGGPFHDSALEMWAKYAARHNAGMAAYRETIIAQLRAEGHTVTEEGDPDQDAKKAITEIRTEIKEDQHEGLVAQGIATCSAEPISDDEYKDRAQSTKPQTEPQKLEMDRKKLSKRYGPKPTLPIFILDQGGWYEKIKLDYYLNEGRERLNAQSKEKLLEQIEASAGNGLWLPDIARVSTPLKIAALEWLNVPQLQKLAGTDEQIHQDHPLVVSILKKAQSNTKAIKEALGITITQKTRPISFVRELLDKVGFGLKRQRKITSNGKQVWPYLIEQVDSKIFKLGPKDAQVTHEYSYSREAIFEHWLERDERAAAAVKAETVKIPETTEQQEAEPVDTENKVGISGNSTSIPNPNAYITPPTKRQDEGAQNPPSDLTQIEQVCLNILQTIDCWGQYLNVKREVGAQRLDQLLGMLTGKQQRVIRTMEPQWGTS